MSTSELAIDLRNVAKTYRGRVHALRGIDMRVRRGEVFGLLGPNGAGKSTLVKIIMTVIRPTHVEGSVLSAPVGHKSTLARVGYLPENHRFPRYLTGRQTLDFFAALSKVPRRARRQNADRLLDIVGMTAWARKRIGTYSKGMMQRIGLAQAMMNDPDLILLDEPTDGVDPVGRREIRDVLLNLKHAGKTVFINSHLLSELEMICDRVGILVGGQVATQGTLDELALSKQWYEIELLPQNGTAPRDSIVNALPSLVPDPSAADRWTLGTGPWAELSGATLKIGTTDPAEVQPILDSLRRANLVVRRVQSIRPSLEELFMAAVQQTQSQQATDAARDLPGARESESNMTTATTQPIPDYAKATPSGGWMTQTIALFVDAYRELNHKKLFWIVLILSVVVVAGFAIPGINERGVTLFKLEFPGMWNTSIISPGEFYKMMFILFAIPIWLAWIATILAIVSTASIFPDMLTGGSIDLYLAKPISRLRLFVTKYLTGLMFVLLQVTLFSATAFVVIGIRGKSWEPGLFLAVPVMVIFFSYLFAVSALLGVLTRSTIAAMLLTLLVWVFIWASHTAHQTISLFRITSEVKQERLAGVIKRNDDDIARYEEQLRQQQLAAATQPGAATTAPTTMASTTQPTGVAGLISNIKFQRETTLRQKNESLGTLKNLQLADRIADAATTVLPKTGQTIDLLRRGLINAAHLPGQYDEEERSNSASSTTRSERSGRRRGGNRDDPDFNPADPEVARRLRNKMDSESPLYVIGTSLAFEAVVLALAAWVFCRRDY